MNNQKVTKLSARDQEIATLKKEKSFLAGQVKSLEKDLSKRCDEIQEQDSERNVIGGKYYKMAVELDKIKSHWLYKLINWFK